MTGSITGPLAKVFAVPSRVFVAIVALTLTESDSIVRVRESPAFVTVVSRLARTLDNTITRTYATQGVGHTKAAAFLAPAFPWLIAQDAAQ
jgi:hypothetical protein